MKIINFLEGQGSKEWLEWRRGGIGASDIAVIMGTSRFKTPLALWNEKCGFAVEDSITPAMAHGMINEGKARRWLNENLDLDLKPLCVEDPHVPYFRASLDGYDSDKKILVEIKCPVNPAKTIADAKHHHKVAEYWMDQNLWQIMFTNPIRSMIAIWDHEKEECYTVENFCIPDRIAEMREKAATFWRKVQTGIQPEPENGDYIIIETPQLKKLLSEYGEVDKTEKAAQRRKKELKDQIIEQGDDGNFLSYGYRVTRCRPKATYDVKKMQEDGIDIDKYRRPYEGIGFYKINVPKRK
jgi:putative phage-type endonuclease